MTCRLRCSYVVAGFIALMSLSSGARSGAQDDEQDRLRSREDEALTAAGLVACVRRREPEIRPGEPCSISEREALDVEREGVSGSGAPVLADFLAEPVEASMRPERWVRAVPVSGQLWLSVGHPRGPPWNAG